MIDVDKKLLAKLPRSFVPLLNEQLKQWDLLFPAERRSISATLKYLSGLPAPEFQRLFASVKSLEAKMSLPAWNRSSRQLSIADTSVLARSPHYARWRVEVEKVFAEINTWTEALAQSRPANKLIVCVLPAGLPLPAEPFRPQLAKQGRWILLRRKFGETANEFVAALAQRRAAPRTEPIERTWVLECEPLIARSLSHPTLTVLSYDSLVPARAEFRKRLNAIQKDLRSADRTYQRLRRLDIAPLLGPRLGDDARLGEFIRALFLSGNGAVLFNNSFIQWGAAEALRRAQPQVLVCFFGVRHKLKPFSSLVLFEEQNRANPVPDQDDPAGSLIDIQILCEYVRLTTDRLPAYRGRTLALFAAADLNRMLLLAPPDFPPLPDFTEKGAGLAQLNSIALDWLSAD